MEREEGGGGGEGGGVGEGGGGGGGKGGRGGEGGRGGGDGGGGEGGGGSKHSYITHHIDQVTKEFWLTANKNGHYERLIVHEEYFAKLSFHY